MIREREKRFSKNTSIHRGWGASELVSACMCVCTRSLCRCMRVCLFVESVFVKLHNEGMLSITNLAHIRTNSYTAILEPHTYHIQQRMIRISYNMMYICYANRLYVRPNSAFLEFAQFERIIIRVYSTHI